MSFQHFLKQCFEKKSKRCILPVLRQKSTQKSQRGSAKCTCYSASKLSEKHKAQIFAPLNFFYINTNALTKIMLLSSFWNCAYWIKSAIFTSELDLWWKLSKSLVWIFTLKTKVKYLNLSLEIQIMTSKKLKKYNCHGVRIWNAQRFYPNLSLQLFSECQKCKQIGRALNKTGVTQ